MAGVAVKRGDIVLVKVPFLDDPAKGKVRPVVVVQNDVGNRFGRSTIIVPVTSSIPSKLYPVQLLLPAGKETGLRVKSVVDAGYFFTLRMESIIEWLGRIPAKMMPQLDIILKISLELAPGDIEQVVAPS
jgi:mRNA interferase MazF